LTSGVLVYSSGMFVKVTSSGSRRYLQLVEAYRDDLGNPGSTVHTPKRPFFAPTS